jgi:hypothetical protein|tara:strand:+ start:385 stop:681 length:297 start_codon:yes stop_codon:yes gene_type:complete
MFIDGDIMGIVDNVILAICAYAGIDIDKKLGNNGLNGAITGALLGNALSDLVGAAIDPSTRHLAWGIFAGCMYVYIVIKLWEVVHNLWVSWKGYKEIG